MNKETRLLAFQVGAEESDKTVLDKQEATAKTQGEELKAQADKLLTVLNSQDFADHVVSGKGDKKAFIKSHEITAEDLQSTLVYAKYLYECGQYDQSSSILSNYMHV